MKPKIDKVLSLDFDGTADGIFQHDKNTDSYTVDTTHIIYRFIQTLRARGENLVIMLGTNRQSDISDRARNQHGKAIDAYKALVNTLNADSHLPAVIYDKFRLQDMADSYGWTNDHGWENKLDLILHQSHHIARNYQRSTGSFIPLMLIDDSTMPGENEIEDVMRCETTEQVAVLNDVKIRFRRDFEDYSQYIQARKNEQHNDDFLTATFENIEQNPELIPEGIKLELYPFFAQAFPTRYAAQICEQKAAIAGSGPTLSQKDLFSALDTADRASGNDVHLYNKFTQLKHDGNHQNLPVTSDRELNRKKFFAAGKNVFCQLYQTAFNKKKQAEFCEKYRSLIEEKLEGKNKIFDYPLDTKILLHAFSHKIFSSVSLSLREYLLDMATRDVKKCTAIIQAIESNNADNFYLAMEGKRNLLSRLNCVSTSTGRELLSKLC